MIMVVFCYLSDCSIARKRTATFARMEALLFAAFLSGPALGGALAELPGGPVNTFYACLAGELVVLLYVVLVLPESLGFVPADDRIEETSDTIGSHIDSIPHVPLPSRRQSESNETARLANVKSSMMETMSVFLVSRQDSVGRKQGKLSRILLVTIAFVIAISFAGLQFSFGMFCRVLRDSLPTLTDSFENQLVFYTVCLANYAWTDRGC